MLIQIYLKKKIVKIKPIPPGPPGSVSMVDVSYFHTPSKRLSLRWQQSSELDFSKYIKHYFKKIVNKAYFFTFFLKIFFFFRIAVFFFFLGIFFNF